MKDDWKLDPGRGGFVRPDGALIGHAGLVGIGRSGMASVARYAKQQGISDWDAYCKLLDLQSDGTPKPEAR